MSLPINIEKLINGKTIEWERLEFKKSWNPEDVVHTMCAFANDVHNWGGGYIIIGINEENGKPILPPDGLKDNQLDAIQKKIVALGYKISPHYFPITEPYQIADKSILVVWCPAGDNRPYEAPESLSKKAARKAAYIRITSNTVKAKDNNLRRLRELTARIPFDDRMNNLATIDDLNLGLIREYLQDIKSNLLEASAAMPFPDLCRTMHIAKGPNEDIRPLNVGLLFFSRKPETFFNRAWIELVWHTDELGKNFSEVYFKGPLHKQLREAVAYLQNNIITEKVLKHPDKAEAERYFNYPFEAVEEALSNAIYHKSYEIGNPIEIQIFPDKITILSYPGPMPPVDAKILASQKRIIAREYRNRRIGDFLKELGLTEGRGTGFPNIYQAMEGNNSPQPKFETDELNYVMVTLPVHPAFKEKEQASDQVNENYKILTFKNLEEIIVYSNQAHDQVDNGVSKQAGKKVNNGADNGAINGANNGADGSRSYTFSKETVSQVRALVENELHGRVLEILEHTENWIKRTDLFEKLNLTNQSTNRKRYLDPLLEINWLQLKFPENTTHPFQSYKITPAGERILTLLKTKI